MNEQQADEQVLNVTTAYEKLVEGPLSGWSRGKYQLLKSLLESGNYFELTGPVSSTDVRLSEAFHILKMHVAENFSEQQDQALQMLLKEILLTQLQELGESIGASRRAIVKENVMYRLPSFRENECEHFVDTFEDFITHTGKRYVPCRVYLFGPFARGKGNRKCYVNIAVISDGFATEALSERETALRPFVKNSRAMLRVIGLTNEESKSKYPIGKTTFLFACTVAGQADTWILSERRTAAILSNDQWIK